MSAEQQIPQVPADGQIVVGIPSRNEARTIATVVRAAVDGLWAVGLDTRAVLLNCDNGSTYGTP
jgi:hypothetical protein